MNFTDVGVHFVFYFGTSIEEIGGKYLWLLFAIIRGLDPPNWTYFIYLTLEGNSANFTREEIEA